MERKVTIREKKICRHQGELRRRGMGWFRFQRFPCSPWWRLRGGRCPPVAHGSPQWSRYARAICGEPHTGADGCPKEPVTLWKGHTGAGSWEYLWLCGDRSPCWSRFDDRTCDPMGDTLEQFIPEELHPLEMTRTGSRFEIEFQSILLIHRPKLKSRYHQPVKYVWIF